MKYYCNLSLTSITGQGASNTGKHSSTTLTIHNYCFQRHWTKSHPWDMGVRFICIWKSCSLSHQASPKHFKRADKQQTSSQANSSYGWPGAAQTLWNNSSSKVSGWILAPYMPWAKKMIPALVCLPRPFWLLALQGLRIIKQDSKKVS